MYQEIKNLSNNNNNNNNSSNDNDNVNDDSFYEGSYRYTAWFSARTPVTK